MPREAPKGERIRIHYGDKSGDKKTVTRAGYLVLDLNLKI